MALIAALGLPLMFSGVFASQASAHGAQSDPADRNFFCRFMDNVENPQTAGCKAAKAVQGSNAVYNFNSSLISNANSRVLDAVPDGQICNAGNAGFAGFNLAPATAGYAATSISAGPREFRYLGTAPHKTSYFKVFISKPSYDGSRPLMKADLDMIADVRDSVLAGDTFRFMVNIPARAAGSKAVIFTQWQRVAQESGEGYYTCADVVYK
jgi:chitin-binding protein